MIRLPESANDLEILAIVYAWAEALSQEDYALVYEMTYHPADDHIDKNLIRQLIENYGSIEPMGDGSKFKVTALDSAVGDLKPRHEVTRYDQSDEPNSLIIGDIWFDLPLNGAWSDLTALFDIVLLEGTLVLQLHDIHVM
ncbi:MAG: hypothetical protein H7Y37_11430 [Anaerolineae bacterium]|nr:hypothetical protein [Gloeobacterales cyanobacterium ES-bin-313]